MRGERSVFHTELEMS